VFRSRDVTGAYAPNLFDGFWSPDDDHGYLDVVESRAGVAGSVFDTVGLPVPWHLTVTSVAVGTLTIRRGASAAMQVGEAAQRREALVRGCSLVHVSTSQVPGRGVEQKAPAA
jgi:hypothetical protein